MPEGDGYAPQARAGDSSELLAIRIFGLPMDGSFDADYEVEIELSYHPSLDYSALLAGCVFQLVEGRRIVGEGRIVSVAGGNNEENPVSNPVGEACDPKSGRRQDRPSDL